MCRKFFLPAILVVASIAVVLITFTTAEEVVREPARAGQFYPADKDQLSKDVAKYLSDAKTEKIDGQIVALICPHAGYQFSGPTAAYGYSLLKDKKYKRIIILSANHRLQNTGIVITDYTKYNTPLGAVAVDVDACNELAKNPVFIKMRPKNDKEHSIEVQLPFLQMTLKDFKIVPLIVCDMTKDDYSKAAEALKKFLNEETLFIVSTDFTHHGPDYGYVKFTENLKENLKKLDSGAVEKILKLDFDGFLNYHKDTEITICGYSPILTLLAALPKETQAKELHYTTSGEILNDWTSSVSYESIVFWVKELSMLEKDPEELSLAEKKTLVKLAKDTVETFVKTGKLPDVSKGGYELTERLKKDGEVFVTLKEKGHLRGCIGTMEEYSGKIPLYEAIMESAKNSATEDPRFSPVDEDELKDLSYEITVLTPRKLIDDYKKIEIGTHGIVVSKGGRRALFLPQVPVEWKWDRETYLSECCEKAGLPSDAWKEGCKIYTFRGLVFDEDVLKK